MNPKKQIKFKISGFVISLILVAMCAGIFGGFFSAIQQKMGVTSDFNPNVYNKTSSIIDKVEQIKSNTTNLDQNVGILDVIGGYFRSGYAALQITFGSFDLFNGIIEQGVSDVPYLSYFKMFLWALLLASLVIGVIVAALLKWYI